MERHLSLLNGGRGSTTRWRKLRAALLGTRCAQCGTPGDSTNPLSLDHIVPRLEGGTDHPANLRTLCRRCNSSRPKRLAPRARSWRGGAAIPPSRDW